MFQVEFWGPMACFCPPYAKVDRLSYPVPTPSAVRGALASVYSKPAEFWWAVEKIEVMNPIAYISFRRNEVGRRLDPKRLGCIDASDPKVRSQRMMVCLKDVRYRVTARIVGVVGGHKPLSALYAQAERRFSTGQCFQQPYLGLRECVCDFAIADGAGDPIPDCFDFGFMTYDTHVPYDNRKDAPFVKSLYHAVMDRGVILVPDYDSVDVIKDTGPKGGVYDAAGVV